ncbi:rhamnan synthesis F family protein [Microbacterium memoriense]|uniref:Rhamnan synthesis F family protein n=1 Tax=Microbacterium memoriense TaxID=2978350 RepID=A0ABT2PDW9_9MICO|nr:rhamnan synthesis F family protein [Microbacterium memoriense]MCT9002795.1 rhamnan synthesis F family protein [Microbacterium memoriense]
MSVVDLARVVDPAPYPENGQRLVVYTIWDRRGEVEGYVLHALHELRPHASRIVVVVNGTIDVASRAALEEVVDDVLVRPNEGYDIWAHKAALDYLGDTIAGYDELILTNDTWFGPVRPFGPVLERMSAEPIHFWGMTDHQRQEPNPFTGKGVLEYHVQSFWIAVRRAMFLSPAWSQYWRDLPPMPDYFDAVLLHEAVFTAKFADDGYRHSVAFASVDYPTDHPALFNADLLLDDGCPIVKRRPFFHYPPFLIRNAVIGRQLVAAIAEHGYPTDLLWQNLSRNVAPKTLHANAGMLEILPRADLVYNSDHEMRVFVAVHIHYPEMTNRLLDFVDNVPGCPDVVITTSDASRAAAIRAVVDERPTARGAQDIRVVASNDGRDQSAFLIACRAELLSGNYDLVVKLHSKLTPQDDFNVGRHFQDQQFTNLLDTSEYADSVLALFQREPGLGLVFPPMIHVGQPTMGHAWWANRPGVSSLCDTLGIRVPLDHGSPLAPFGSMFVARPEAIRLLVEHDWSYDAFGGADAYRDGGLAHILERMPCYAAGELGYHSRTISTSEYMSVSHTSLEFTLDEISQSLPGDSVEAIHYLRGVGHVGQGRLVDFARMYVRLHFPGTGAALRRVVGRETRVGRVLRRMVGRAVE